MCFADSFPQFNLQKEKSKTKDKGPIFRNPNNKTRKPSIAIAFSLDLAYL